MKDFTLLIVDCQNDYTSPDGKMHIEKSDKAISNICKFIVKNKENINRIIFACDNHSPKHRSFRKNGGEWPEHCIENTFGSKINSELVKTCKDLKLDYFVLNKGEVDNFEEYSASMYSEHLDGAFVLKTATDSRCVYTDDIVVCGMPGDVGVKATLEDLSKQLSPQNVYIYLNGVVSLDGNNEIMRFLEDNVDVQIL